jgi:spore coat polysaccharide biosynthesis protein SpsF (cytidylyltransferase family)
MEKMEKRTGIIIQARMGSTRLPNKVLMNISEKPLLWHVIERCKKAHVNKIIVATSINKKDDEIQKFCEENMVDFFRGSEENVLERYYKTAKKFELDIILRITGDCPLISPTVINKMIEKFNNEDLDYLSNVSTRSFPRGLDCEIFSFKTLEKTYKLAKEKRDKEHVTTFIYGNPKRFRIGEFFAEGKLKNTNIRLCVDTEKDLKLIKIIYSKLYSGNIILITDVINFLEKKPQLIKINQEEEKKQREINIKEKINQK